MLVNICVICLDRFKVISKVFYTYIDLYPRDYGTTRNKRKYCQLNLQDIIHIYTHIYYLCMYVYSIFHCVWTLNSLIMCELFGFFECAVATLVNYWLSLGL